MSHGDRLSELWRVLDDNRRLDLINRYFADDYVRHSEEGTMSRDDFRNALLALHTAFPDLRTRIQDVLEEGNRVAYRWQAVGTHKAPYLGAPPTNRVIEARGITITTFGEDGRIIEEWASWNKVSVLHALGVIPLESEPITYNEERR